MANFATKIDRHLLILTCSADSRDVEARRTRSSAALYAWSRGQWIGAAARPPRTCRHEARRGETVHSYRPTNCRTCMDLSVLVTSLARLIGARTALLLVRLQGRVVYDHRTDGMPSERSTRTGVSQFSVPCRGCLSVLTLTKRVVVERQQDESTCQTSTAPRLPARVLDYNAWDDSALFTLKHDIKRHCLVLAMTVE